MLGEEEGREGVQSYSVCLPKQPRDGALLSWRWLNTCLPVGNSELIPCFALIARTSFAFPVKLSLCLSSSFLTFTHLILFPIPLGKNE